MLGRACTTERRALVLGEQMERNTSHINAKGRQAGWLDGSA